ncbi:MAG: hypothetical protein AAFR13_00175, partial [Pseudomonadota bacterium]
TSLAVGASLSFSSLISSASAQDVEFNGTVGGGSGGNCSIVVLNDGTLRANAGKTLMTSRIAGAVSGLARVTNTSFARVSAPMYLITWNTPPDDTSYSDVRAYISGTSVSGDGTNHPELDGNSGFNLSHTGGVTDVTVNLEGRKYFGNFSDGLYSGTVVLLCS